MRAVQNVGFGETAHILHYTKDVVSWTTALSARNGAKLVPRTAMVVMRNVVKFFFHNQKFPEIMALYPRPLGLWSRPLWKKRIEGEGKRGMRWRGREVRNGKGGEGQILDHLTKSWKRHCLACQNMCRYLNHRDCKAEFNGIIFISGRLLCFSTISTSEWSHFLWTNDMLITELYEITHFTWRWRRHGPTTVGWDSTLKHKLFNVILD